MQPLVLRFFMCDFMKEVLGVSGWLAVLPTLVCATECVTGLNLELLEYWALRPDECNLMSACKSKGNLKFVAMDADERSCKNSTQSPTKREWLATGKLKIANPAPQHLS